MNDPAQDNGQTQSGLTDFINAIKGQALNMGALTQAFQSLSTALLNALAYVSTVFVGDSGSGGKKGLVPAPAAGDTTARKYLFADGTWEPIPNPSSTQIGGVKSLAAATHQFLTEIGTDGTVSQAQPTTGDLSCTTTNDNAAAGALGEIITSNIASGSAVSISSGISKDVTSINLTGGDWDVYGWVGTVVAGPTTISTFQCGISTTTANLGSFPTSLSGLSTAAGSNVRAPASTQRLSLSGTTTVYLVVSVSFAVSTNSAYGYITARRAR